MTKPMTPETPTPKRMLVLGGGSDIAAAFIERCADADLELVVLAGRAGGSVDTVAATMVDAHPDLQVEVSGFDATEADRHQAALRALDERHGPFDTIVVAFGVLGEPFDLRADPADVAALVEVNFSGAASASLAALDVLRGEPGARLIVISSIAAVRPRFGNLAYSSAKAGLDAFVDGLRAPARELGIDVVTVRPGFVHSRMTEGLEPAPFATTPAEVADDLWAGLAAGRTVIHSPNVLAPVGRVLRALPGPIWRRISQR